MSSPNEAIIEVSIPMRYFDATSDDPDCAICAEPVCPSGECAKSATDLTCCDQSMCCGCFSKLLRRCRCTQTCAAVVGTCPFCRNMCRADALSAFLAQRGPCRDCRKKKSTVRV